MDTRLAVIERTSEDLLLIRIKANVTIDKPGIQEILDAGRAMHLDDLFPKVVVTIPEDAGVDLSVMRMNHDEEEHLIEFRGLLAIASESTLLHGLAKIYFAYLQRNFPVGVFTTVQEAMSWVDERQIYRSAGMASSS